MRVTRRSIRQLQVTGELTEAAWEEILAILAAQRLRVEVKAKRMRYVFVTDATVSYQDMVDYGQNILRLSHQEIHQPVGRLWGVFIKAYRQGERPVLFDGTSPRFDADGGINAESCTGLRLDSAYAMLIRLDEELERRGILEPTYAVIKAVLPRGMGVGLVAFLRGFVEYKISELEREEA